MKRCSFVSNLITKLGYVILLKMSIFKSISNVPLESWMHLLRQAESTVVQWHISRVSKLIPVCQIHAARPDCAPMVIAEFYIESQLTDTGAQWFAKRQLVIQKMIGRHIIDLCLCAP